MLRFRQYKLVQPEVRNNIIFRKLYISPRPTIPRRERSCFCFKSLLRIILRSTENLLGRDAADLASRFNLVPAISFNNALGKTHSLPYTAAVLVEKFKASVELAIRI